MSSRCWIMSFASLVLLMGHEGEGEMRYGHDLGIDTLSYNNKHYDSLVLEAVRCWGRVWGSCEGFFLRTPSPKPIS